MAARETARCGACVLALGLARPELPLRAATAPADGIEVNRLEPVSAWPVIAPLTYDSEPTAAQLPDGALWVAWQSYDAGRERIVGRVVRDARSERPEEISGAGIVCHPKVVARDATNAVFFWNACENGAWRVKSRALQDGQWSAEALVSALDAEAIQPTAIAVGSDRIVAAWIARRNGRLSVCVRERIAGAWSAPHLVSDERADAFRPALAATSDGETWAVWDTYINGEYAVRARKLGPEMGKEETVSPANVKSLNGALLASPRFGLCAAWVKVADVIGGDGVIDQFHTLQLAVRREGRWEVAHDSGGSKDAAELHHGFLAKMEPKPVWSTGYLGRRRQPLLTATEEGIWLLWERKADHLASTPNATGELLGRRYDGAWQPPVRVHAGLIEYHLATGARAAEGRLPILGSTLPRERRRIYEVQSANLRSAERIAFEPWAGWKPVRLPLRPPAERPAVTVAGKTYRLFWVDTHVHSNLTADAEGEPDEIIHYARDKALLDAVVIQENDLLYDVPLTESEYALGGFFARCYYRANRFLVLPGYEWTQIVPVGDADPARPQFWKASTRNHRTVVYPVAGGPLLRYTEVGNDIGRLYTAVEKHGGITHAQHQTFELNGHPAENAVEVTAGWGIYFLNTARIHRALEEGYRVGFVGTTDGHRRTPGLSGGITGVYAEELTDRAILAAYRARRVFATTGTRFAVEAWVNDTFMGGETTIARGGKAGVTVKVQSPTPVRRVVLVSDGAEVRSFAGDGRREVEFMYDAGSLASGRHWFYWRVETEGPNTRYPGNLSLAEGNLGWSTPVWVTQQ